jgi:hypothetical protein
MSKRYVTDYVSVLERLGEGCARHPLRLSICVLLAAFLAWRIVVTNLAVHLIDVAPRAALLLGSSNPRVLVELVDREVNRDAARVPGIAARSSGAAQKAGATLSPARRDRLRAWTEAAIAQSPLDAKALRLLGQLSADRSAESFMEVAARRSLNETRAHYWLLQRRLAQARYADVLHHADILLRSRPELVDFVVPALVVLAENRSAAGALEQALARNPPWRERFFSRLPEFVTDVRAPLRLMLSLKTTPFPASADEQRPYLTKLLERGAYDFAHFAWRSLLASQRAGDVDLLENGDFARPPSGLPFDWTIARGAGVGIDIVPRPDDAGGRALMIDFGHGRAGPHVVQQYVKLAPGAYRMAGRLRGDLVGRRGLRWRVACVNGPQAVGESEMAIGRFPVWKRFQFAIVVPEKDCPLQMVRLALDARSPSEWMASGRIWYADLKIEPSETGAPSLR